MKLIIELICLAMLIGGFTFGALKLFKKGKPLYLQLFIIATGCRMIERLIVVVTLLCGIEEGDISIATFLGMFSYALFAFSANYGVMDSVVDDRSNKANRKYRLIALIFPVIVLVPAVFIIIRYVQNYSVFSGVVIAIATLPVYGAAYYNFKFGILPNDETGILKVIRPLNWIAVASYFVGILNNLIASTMPDSIWAYAVHLLVCALPLALCIVAVKGAEKWKTLI